MPVLRPWRDRLRLLIFQLRALLLVFGETNIGECRLGLKVLLLVLLKYCGLAAAFIVKLCQFWSEGLLLESIDARNFGQTRGTSRARGGLRAAALLVKVSLNQLHQTAQSLPGQLALLVAQ